MAPLKGPRPIVEWRPSVEDDSDLDYFDKTIPPDPNNPNPLPRSRVRRLHQCKIGRCAGLVQPGCAVAHMVHPWVQHSPADIFRRYGNMVLLQEPFWTACLLLGNIARNPDVSLNDGIAISAAKMFKLDPAYRERWLRDDHIDTRRADVAKAALVELVDVLTRRPLVPKARSFEPARVAVQLEEMQRAKPKTPMKVLASRLAAERKAAGKPMASLEAVNMAKSRGQDLLGWRSSRRSSSRRKPKSFNRVLPPRR